VAKATYWTVTDTEARKRGEHPIKTKKISLTEYLCEIFESD